MYHVRLATARLSALLRAFPAVVVAGARQVGKTTFVRHVLGDRGDYVVFDPVIDVENARRDPDLFLDQHRRFPLVLDEIQYAKELLPALKRRIDRDRAPGRYVLTGSQQWQVLTSLSESLAGRVVFLDLEGLCLAEIADAAHPRGVKSWIERWLASPERYLEAEHPRLEDRDRPLFERLWRGFLPEADAIERDVVPDFHTAYQRTYIERDARLLGDVSDWQEFGRFFRLAAALTAQEVNQSKLGRDIGITPQTARRWLDMLVATFQWHEVPAWSGNTVKRVSQRPKGYLSDTGLACAALRISSPSALADHPAVGPIFETAVVGEVRRLMSVMSPRPLIHHWRAHAGAEVDLLIERDGILFPLEVRLTTRPSADDARGIAAFRAAHPRRRIAPGVVVTPSPRAVRLTKTEIAIPWDQAAE